MREIEEEFTDSGFKMNEFQLVLAEDVINVIKVFNNETCIVPFSRQAADQISVFTDDNGNPIINKLPFKIVWVDYNPTNHSLLLVGPELEHPRIFISIEIPSIKSGITTTSQKHLFQGESTISCWALDIAHCRGIISYESDEVFKIYELREYSQLFTISKNQWPIPNPTTGTPFTVRFGGPGNGEMVIYRKVNEKSILFKIYSKLNGKQVKEFILPLDSEEDDAEFVLLCGRDRMVLQLELRNLEVYDISSENPI